MKNLFHDSVPTMAAVQYSPEDSHASHSARQGSALERKMTVTSGQKCCALLETSDRAGLLVKTLLASSRWYNRLTSLRWNAIPICSERVMRFRRSTDSSPSTGSAKILRPLDIPSGRWLFRLVPSRLPTDVTECGSLPPMPLLTVLIDGRPVDLPPRLLPTPMANIKGAGLNVNSKKMAAKKEAIYLENAVAGLVVRAGVSGIFRMNHRFALTMMGYAPNHCAAGYERILRTVCLMMKSKKLSATPINDSTKKP